MLCRRNIRKDIRAEMGVGTLIVFISMILVAAIAGSVLIATTTQLQDQATRTGNDAIQNVGTGLQVIYTGGKIGTGSDNSPAITELTFYVKLYDGSPSIDPSKITIVISSSDSEPANYAGLSTAEGDIDAAPTDGSATQKIIQGTTWTLKVELDNPIGEGQRVTVRIIPETGVITVKSLLVPEALTGSYVALS